MKFTLECGGMDGLVFIDKGYLTELNCDMLYAMDILLDPLGESELVFDFPNEAWDTVRSRETKGIREFCGQGKMIIWLFDGMTAEWEIAQSNEIADPPKWLHLPTGKLLAVTASELIQCLSYPELEMEALFELPVEAGWYAVWNEGVDKIRYCRKEAPSSIPSNIQEESERMQSAGHPQLTHEHLPKQRKEHPNMDLFHRLKNAYLETLRPTVQIPEGPCTPLVRRRYRFSGCVQGVGFRYQAQVFASQLGLTGWAGNQSDGSVLIEIEGETGRINAFLQAMQEVPRFDITDIQTENLPLSGSETTFGIRY